MEITFDVAKRLQTLHDRGLDFVDCLLVFAGPTIVSMRKANAREKARFSPSRDV